MYTAVLVRLQVFSDISVHLPYTSASSPVYPLPPPTTLLGALAYSYLKGANIANEIIKDPDSDDVCSPAIKLVNDVPYASAGSKGYIGYRFLERIYQAPYLRKDYQQQERQWWGIAQRGGITFHDDELYIFYITRDVSIAKYAWGIVRIGRKESHVSVIDVQIKRVSEVAVPDITDILTFMYAPSKLFHSCENAIEIELPVISRENFCRASKPSVEKFYIPLGDRMKCNVKKTYGTVLDMNGVYVVVPNEYLRVSL